MVKSILTYLNHFSLSLLHIQGKKCSKMQFLDTVFFVMTFVVHATWSNVILLNITPLNKCDQTMTKKKEHRTIYQENVKHLNNSF